MVNKIRWLVDYYIAFGYPIQEFNLIGIRDETGKDKDVINDYLGYWTKQEFFLTTGTTDPSVFYTKDQNERNPRGTFHLDYGFHEKIWIIGTHKGYEAFQNKWPQCKPTRGWRDKNFNFVKDADDFEVCEYCGINFHRMHLNFIQRLIGKYSAGCQVVNPINDYLKIMADAKKTEMYKQDKLCTFDYMLFRINEVPAQLVA